MNDKPISLADDADLLTPAETAVRLAGLTRHGTVEADYYGNGGAVAAFEAKVAAYLGKERAVLFPTGTLANLVAMRLLAGTAGGRIIVHEKSHFFNDMGDNLSLLGGFTMVPLRGTDAGFSGAEVAAEIGRAADARVAARIGAVAIETPSRRMHGRRFGTGPLAEVVGVARMADIPLFLDGARIVIECAWTGQGADDIAAPFDLVYLSLYKYLDAPFGCVLAGPASLLDGVFHDRRRFGGSLWEMWPAAVLAGDALDRQSAQWAEARSTGDAVLERVAARGINVTRFADGTNICLFDIPADAPDIAASAGRAGLKVLPPAGNLLTVKINASWLRTTPDDLADRITAMFGRRAAPR